jgi:outer membrane lipoprotein-sorting protein
MECGKNRWGIGLLLVLAVAVAAVRSRAAVPADGFLSDLRAAHARVTDLVMEVERTEVREDELRRMKRNATTALEFDRIKIYFMAPDCVRIEGKRGLMPVTMVENGGTQTIRLALGIKKSLDVAGNPRRKQGGLEFGLLTGQVWQDYHVTEVGRERVDGRPVIVLQLKVRGDLDGGYQQLWVDAETYRVVRRDRLSGDGQLRFRQVFREPIRSAVGTWLSRRIEIYNEHNRFVGSLQTISPRVNQGIAPNLFRP